MMSFQFHLCIVCLILIPCHVLFAAVLPATTARVVLMTIYHMNVQSAITAHKPRPLTSLTPVYLVHTTRRRGQLMSHGV